MTDEQLEKIMEDLIRIYGDELPNPDHQPMVFSYLLKLYMKYTYET
jgi:hypothetical protein